MCASVVCVCVRIEGAATTMLQATLCLDPFLYGIARKGEGELRNSCAGPRPQVYCRTYDKKVPLIYYSKNAEITPKTNPKWHPVPFSGR